MADEAFEAKMRELLATPEGRHALRTQAQRGLEAGMRLRRVFPDARNRVRGWIALLRAVRLVERKPQLVEKGSL